MRSRLLALFGVLLFLAGTAAILAGQARTLSSAQALPPLSYVCPMPSDAAVLEDKAGKCPQCGMVLVPVRLESKWWCPTHQTTEVHDGPGTCPRDGKALVQVTLSEFWTCADAPTDHLLEPGACANGQPRKIGYDVRAHGDHNPRHGGQFFMAENQWHHVEGAYPAPGLFRLYFYDNFTKPLAPGAFSARVEREAGGKTETIPLTASSDGRTLQARLAPAPFPVKLKAWVRFAKQMREQPFDFGFDAVSADPVVTPTPAAVSTSSRPPAAERKAAAAPTAPRKEAAPAQAPVVPPAEAANVLDKPLQVPPALAEAQDESKLPSAVPDLLAELTSRAKEVETLVNEGNLSQVWLPATGTKTVALVLDSRASTLPESQRVAVSASVKRVVTAAWELDAYGDLGNKQKIAEAYQRLASAVTDLKAAYATR